MLPGAQEALSPFQVEESHRVVATHTAEYLLVTHLEKHKRLTEAKSCMLPNERVSPTQQSNMHTCSAVPIYKNAFVH